MTDELRTGFGHEELERHALLLFAACEKHRETLEENGSALAAAEQLLDGALARLGSGMLADDTARVMLITVKKIVRDVRRSCEATS